MRRESSRNAAAERARPQSLTGRPRRSANPRPSSKTPAATVCMRIPTHVGRSASTTSVKASRSRLLLRSLLRDATSSAASPRTLSSSSSRLCNHALFAIAGVDASHTDGPVCSGGAVGLEPSISKCQASKKRNLKLVGPPRPRTETTRREKRQK